MFNCRIVCADLSFHKISTDKVNTAMNNIKNLLDINSKTNGVLLMGVTLVSFSLLAFEIVLVRLLSVMLTYHYVFAVVSLAIFGLGVGSIFVYLFRPEMPGGDNRLFSLAIDSSLLSISMALSSILIIQIGYIGSIRDNILIYCFLLVIPFFFGGALLARIFRMFPETNSMIYGADLVGAAAGCISIIFVLNNFAIQNTILFLSVIASTAALMFAAAGKIRVLWAGRIPFACFITVSVLLGANIVTSFLPDIPIGLNREKEIYEALNDFHGKIVDTKQSAFGRIDLVEYRDYPEWVDLYVDGTAGMPMYRFSGDFKKPGLPIESLKTSFPGYFPFLFLKEDERNNALIIGPGGGRDILLAMMGRVQKVTAVEVNKDLYDMVSKYSSYNGGIFQGLENIDMVIGEGRNHLKGSKEKYDIIMFSLPVTNTGQGVEGYALTENFLFTTEAIIDYMDHLTEEGRLIIVSHNDIEVLRLLSISLTALNKTGVGSMEAMKHVYILGSDDYPTLVLKKTRFEQAEALARYKAAIYRLGYNPLSTYFPHIGQSEKINPALASLETGQRSLSDLENMVREMGYDISPVTDESPFFYKFNNGIPRPVLLVFFVSVVLMMFVVLGPLLFGIKQRKGRFQEKKNLEDKTIKNQICYVTIFSMMGFGFMLVEITLIQRFMLFFSQPVLSTTVVLFSLLVGAGLGSLRSNRLASESLFKGVTNAALITAVLLLVYNFLLTALLNQLLAYNLILRLAAAVILLLPLGFIMGFPFPLAIRSLKEMKMENIIPWMFGINGISSVLGSATTIIIAILFGFTEALFLGAICYLTVFLTSRIIKCLGGNQIILK